MRGYFGLGQLSATEKSDILDQHKSVYNGYQTMQPQVSNTQPLYVYDDISDKDGMVVNNKGEVKKYTNMGINEQVETKEVCDECGGDLYEGMCTECNYGHMEEDDSESPSFIDRAKDFVLSNPELIMALENEDLDESNMCECGGGMYEGICEECGYGNMEEETGHLDDIYSVRDLNLKKGDFDYVEGGGNDYGTFEGMHKKLYKEDNDMDFPSNNDYMDYESSYTQDGVDDTDNEGDGYEDLNASEVTDSEMDEQGGTAYDMDVDNETPAFDFVSGGPNSGYNVNEDDMYGYEPEKNYETMESAWADDELEKELDEIDVSGVQGVYGDMERAYNFDSRGAKQFDKSFDEFEMEGDGETPENFHSDGPGKGGPYQEFSYESVLDEVDEDLKESFITQKNKINEMFNRFKRYN